MEYPTYNGNYLGIVVQNNDPDRRGRVKVFVPHITPTVYPSWVEKSSDIAFKFVGTNIDSDLSVILDDVKKILPWADVALPIVGEVASGRYNDTFKYASTSDTNDITEIYPGNKKTSEIGSNPDGIGEKPGALFDQDAFQLFDAFNNPAETNVNNVNKLSYNYRPETYSNLAKGSFAIPRVGAHVWVFFNGGNPLKPVIFAAAYGKDDWGGIYQVSETKDLGQDYPGEYENFVRSDGITTTTGSTSADTIQVTDTGSYTINTETYRNKYVINQKGGTIAFVNTDNRELLKMTHFSGSFFEMNNQANITLAINNDQKMVVGDSFLTIRGTRNEFSQFDYDNVVQGDHYRKVGDPGRVLLHEEWKKTMDEIADIKQLFDCKRCDPIDIGPYTKILKLNSSKQSKSGVPRLCPVCSSIDDSGRDIAVNNVFDSTGTFGLIVKPQDNSIKSGDGAFGSVKAGGTWSLQFTDGQIAVGQDARLQVNKSGSIIVDSRGTPLLRVPGYVDYIAGRTQIPCPVCNKGIFDNIPGQSASSYQGTWVADPDKLALPEKYNQVMPKLAEIEAALGKGGTEVIEIEKNKIENVGLVMNNWGAIRVDPYGKMEASQVQVFPGFTRIINQPSPLVEIVQVDDLPGGTYTLNVANRYSVLVGAGGVNMKSYGVVNISGAMTNIAGEQVNIGSALETNIDGGKRLSLTGDIVSIAQRDRQGQILLDSNVGITGQTIVRGALYVEGPIYAASEIHAVGKISKTNPDVRSGAAYTGEGLPYDESPTPMGTAITSDKVHIKKDGEDSEGMDIGKGEKPTYMGYTDPQRSVVCAPEQLFIGIVPVGTEIKCTESVFGVPTTKTFTLTQALPVVAAKNVLDANIVAAVGATNAALAKSLTTIAATQPKEIGDEYDLVTSLEGDNRGTYLPGAGYGNVQQQRNLPLRGLPEEAIKRVKIDYSKGDATTAPIVVYGDGSDWDAIKMAPGSTTFLAPAVDLTLSNADLRYQFIENGNIPTLAGHGSNVKKVDTSQS